MSDALLILFAVAAATLAVIAVFHSSPVVRSLLDHVDAKIHLLEEQAAHVNQTARAEASNFKETIEAYEKQGANKLRSELARLGSLSDVEARLGFKLKAVSEEALEEAKAKARTIINGLEAELEKFRPRLDLTQPPAVGASAPADTQVYNGQPSPGASVQA